MKLHDLAIRRGVAFTMLFLALIALGLISVIRLKPELLPDMEYPVISVITTYQNVSAEDIETLITRPIEEAVSTVSRVKEVSSISKEGTSIITIEFEWGTDMDAAALDVKDRIGMIEDFLPEDASKPLVFKFDPSMIPIAFIGVSGSRPAGEIRRIAEEKIEPAFERIDGVAVAQTEGGAEREIQVIVDHRKLAAHGLSIGQVINALRMENLNLPAGSVKEGPTSTLLRTTAEFSSVDEIKEVVVSPGVSPVHIRDIAEVVDSFKEKNTEVRVNGEPGVVVRVQKMSGANTVETVNKVKKAMERLNRELAKEGIRLSIIMDQARIINRSLADLRTAAIQGAILAVLVLLLFLHSFRSTLIIAVAIPTSIIITFLVMDWRGMTLNMMTMGGLALAIGMLVDSAIVVLENAFRHRESGESARRAASIGTSEVANAITASVITTVAVFLPIVFVPGITGLLFRDMALVVVFALLCSLFVAITLIPLMCSRFLKVGDKGRFSSALSRWQKALEERYRSSLEWALNHRKTVILIVAVLFFGTLMMVHPFRMVGTEFIPETDEGRLMFEVKLPVGTRLEETIRAVSEIERKIEEICGEDLEAILTTVGPGEGLGAIFRGGAGEHVATIVVRLTDPDQRERSQKEMETQVLDAISNIPGIEVRAEISSPYMSAFGGAPIVVEIYGYDRQKAMEIADQLKGVLENVRGIYNVHVNVEEPLPEYHILIDRREAAARGMSAAMIANTIQSYVQGTVATRYREGGDEYDVLVRLKEEDRSDRNLLSSLLIPAPTGGLISLNSLARITRSYGPITIERKKQERYITVTAGLKGRDLGSAMREVTMKLAELRKEGKLNLPTDFSIEFGGSAKEQRESFKWLGLAFIGAVFLVYAVMAAQFESLLDPFIIMFTVPLAVIGVIWMLALTGTTLSILSFSGAIMLAGIVVNNGIVMVDYINLLRREYGMNLREAVVEGGRRRMRPVLMTALTTIFGMIPIAIGIGSGAELRAPLARAVIGGLTVSTFLTLFFVPVIYMIFERISARFRGESSDS
jgi:HAE1 family hydrophobic/amphiphilic exporter-1